MCSRKLKSKLNGRSENEYRAYKIRIDFLHTLINMQSKLVQRQREYRPYVLKILNEFIIYLLQVIIVYEEIKYIKLWINNSSYVVLVELYCFDSTTRYIIVYAFFL